jgi:hypothetical protein
VATFKVHAAVLFETVIDMSLSQTQIIQSARDVLANREDESIGQVLVPDEAITPYIDRAVRKLNKILGSSGGLKEVEFSTVSDQQDYDMLTSVGTDVSKVVEVTRSGANLTGYDMLATGTVDPRNGLAYPVGVYGSIPMGLEASAYDVWLQTERARLADQYAWEDVTVATTRKLRLMPCPVSVEKVVVRYTSTGGTISDLPDSATDAMTWAACVGILMGMINRFNSRMQQIGGGDPTSAPSSLERLKALQSQLAEYKALYDAALAEL